MPTNGEILTQDQENILVLLLGWMAASAIKHDEPLPVSRATFLDLLRSLGVQNPEQYWSPGMTVIA